MLGIIRCRTLKCKRNLPKRDRFISVGFIWGNVGTRRKEGRRTTYWSKLDLLWHTPWTKNGKYEYCC